MGTATFLIWLAVGIGAGVIARLASPSTNPEARSPLATTVLGMLGAMVAGLAYTFLGSGPHATFDVVGIACAAVGATAAVLVAGRLGSLPALDSRGGYSTRQRK